MKSIVKKTILKVKPYIPGKPIEEVKREFGLRDVVKLASNENPYGPSPKVLQALRQASRQLNRYPDGDCHELRQALAKKLRVSDRQLIVGNGSDELIILAARAFVRRGDEVVIAKPSFMMYDIASRVEGATVKAIPLKNFRYDLPAMKKAVTKKTKIIFLGNPDNPSGMYLSRKEVAGFLKGLSRKVLVFLDEAYYEYVSAKDYADTVRLLRTHKNVIVTRTFSKIYGLAGLRVGYGIGDAELIGFLNRIREPFSVNSMAQVAALTVLKDQSYYRRLAKLIAEQRLFLYKKLQELDLQYVESFTNFVLVRVPGDASAIARKLLKKGVIIRDMNAWGMKGFIRVTIGTARENQRFLTSLKGIL
jgi:histidinol-phosphate aminotransferase